VEVRGEAKSELTAPLVRGKRQGVLVDHEQGWKNNTGYTTEGARKGQCHEAISVQGVRAPDWGLALLECQVSNTREDKRNLFESGAAGKNNAVVRCWKRMPQGSEIAPEKLQISRGTKAKGEGAWERVEHEKWAKPLLPKRGLTISLDDRTGGISTRAYLDTPY